jgi:hypothetical protein
MSGIGKLDRPVWVIRVAWENNSKKWTATVTVKGRYFGQNFDDFDGYIYVVVTARGAPEQQPFIERSSMN